jgi:histidinol phosphatase-like enzyme (inositol monophosphatase family)
VPTKTYNLDRFTNHVSAMSQSSDALGGRLEAACDMARDAGNLTLDFFQGEATAFERKADDSPVTEADRQAEQLMRDAINKLFPRDAIVGEEFGQQSGTSEYRWILDPIDGTKSFISGVPLYGTLIGLEREGRSIVGVIYMPALGEMIYAATGCGAWYSCGDAPARAARVSTCEALRDGLFVTSQVDSFQQRDAVPVYGELQRRSYITRTWGDCYGYLLVATGRAEVMVDPVMSVWDAAALQPILEEAGGTFTDWKGTPTIFHGEGIGTNKLVLDEVLAITRPAAEAASS